MKKKIASLIVSIPLWLHSATYYIDFDAGNNSNAGTSAGAAWKHCPGDANATGNPASATLSAGDRLKFKGGVRYLGAITCNWSGAAGNEIIYDGNEAGDYGTGMALIDGSDPITGWTACANSGEAGGNPNWANLFYKVIPTNTVEMILSGRLHQDDELLWISQEPDLSNPFNYDETTEFYSVGLANVTTTNIVDAVNLTGGDASRWTDAYAIVWRQPNVVDVTLITDYEPASNRITFEALGGDPYDDRDTRYSIINALFGLDQEGEYAMVQEGTDYRIFVWPRNGQTNSLRISTRGFGFNTGSRNHLQFRGLSLARQFGEANNGGTAIGRYTGSTWHSNITVANCFVKHTGKPSGANAAIYIYRCGEAYVTNNVCFQLSKSRGIFLNTGRNSYAQDNRVTNAGRTAITFYLQTNSFLRRNFAVSGGGVHANGMNVYLDSDGVEVSQNYISDSNIGFTFSDSHNSRFFNNIVISTNERCFATFGGCRGSNQVYNNLFLESPAENAAYIRSEDRPYFHFANNILDGSDFGDDPGAGSGGVNRHDNIYTAVYPGVTLGTDEVEIDRSLVFVNPSARDYRLLQARPGEDFSAFFTIDYNGNVRSLWDVGPLSFSGSSGVLIEALVAPGRGQRNHRVTP